MRRNVAVVLVAVLVALSFTGVAVAAHMITGKVISTDPYARVLTIQAQGREMTFSVLEKAAEALPRLKRGDKVTVSYFETWGSPTAESVTKG